MLQKLINKSEQTERIAMKMVNKAYPDTKSLCLF